MMVREMSENVGGVLLTDVVESAGQGWYRAPSSCKKVKTWKIEKSARFVCIEY
jgi:hypothetical protein